MPVEDAFEVLVVIFYGVGQSGHRRELSPNRSGAGSMSATLAGVRIETTCSFQP